LLQEDNYHNSGRRQGVAHLLDPLARAYVAADPTGTRITRDWTPLFKMVLNGGDESLRRTAGSSLLTVARALHSAGLDEPAIRAIWSPLCALALSEPDAREGIQ